MKVHARVYIALNKDQPNYVHVVISQNNASEYDVDSKFPSLENYTEFGANGTLLSQNPEPNSSFYVCGVEIGEIIKVNVSGDPNTASS